MGFEYVTTFLTCVFTLSLMISGFYFLRRWYRKDGDEDFVPETARRDLGAVRMRRPPGRRSAADRMRVMRPGSDASAPQAAAATAPLHSDTGSSDDEEGDKPQKKVGVKKQRKLEEKEAKKEARERELKEREEKRKKDDEERRKRDAEEAAAEADAEALEKRLAEEEERRAAEEYAKLSAQFTVEEEGEDASNTTCSSVDELVNLLRTRKVVLVEDLAAELGLRTDLCLEQIKSLLADERISGVIDDRGKFIYISKEEYEAVALFVKQRGKVTIGELVENSNRLICLGEVPV